MEAMVKKYQQRFRKVRDEMDSWAVLQSRLISQFRNASSIVQRLQVLQDSKNYGCLKDVVSIEEALLAKQMDSLQNILLSMKKTMEEFHVIVLSLGKIHRDGGQMAKGGGSSQLSVKQLQQRVGVKPSLADCLDGLMLLQDMHCSEYLLKSSLVTVPAIWVRSSSSWLISLTSPGRKSNSSSISYLPKTFVDIRWNIGCKLSELWTRAVWKTETSWFCLNRE
ncbi:uncharacterized protein At5g43822-like isoform X1 [Malus sylvestris]|uniref:uncharacterized protein At5g43822-like isoform X1 n=1 Tax=Malus sylvestris TaxID=3752 RepID=UPI0021AC84A9|nr:uncharacterized protein At5g43822-like isoform X1 [Malus sylvestris]